MTKTKRIGINYRKTMLSRDGETFEIGKFWHPIIDSWNPMYRDITEHFDFHKYTCPRPPISLGSIDELVFQDCSDVLRVPIKWGGSNEVRLPKELHSLKDELVRIMQYDRHINPFFTDFFAHITLDNSEVKKDKTQRYPGFHGDGLQGGKFPKKLICEHSYIYVNNNPTEVALHPFFVAHLNDSRYNIFKEFDKQVNRELLYQTIPGHLYLIDPYVVHASPIVKKTTKRTFFRLTLTPSELLMPKNTINPMFEGQEYPARIDVREFVADPDINIPLEYYGLKNRRNS
ncbi:hypothetical protein COU53_01820 [Candidatus Pacearchaeota archaeon CG10_big_fil_rev_8_21_14_0_10_30_48]|nr:MAG: hypothetical protein COU53_01820 [Candidatus Pacearchaeota archaeon CG10_big_fil_rev_8_21_14_0_10_30_48]